MMLLAQAYRRTTASRCIYSGPRSGWTMIALWQSMGWTPEWSLERTVSRQNDCTHFLYARNKGIFFVSFVLFFSGSRLRILSKTCRGVVALAALKKFPERGRLDNHSKEQ